MNTLNQVVDTFLCRALRGEPAPWTKLRDNVLPNEFQLRCEHHGVAALLFDVLQAREEWQTWPEELRRSLELSSKSGIAQDMLRVHYLQEIVHYFSRSGIRFLLVKGEALAQTHYPAPGTRKRRDSDIFIGIEDIEAARRVVLDAGLVIHSPIYKTHQFTVRRTLGLEDGVDFDIHWRILNTSRFARVISFDEAFATSVKLSGIPGVRTLNTTHALVLACLHRVGSERHDQGRLIWIWDIHSLVTGMSYQELVNFARFAGKRNVQSACRSGLSLAQDCFGTVIPGEVLSVLESTEHPHRFAHSNLALLIDDWKQLPTFAARRAMLRELFLPSGESLLRKYRKENRNWLPLLYIRQVFDGLAQRLTLR